MASPTNKPSLGKKNGKKQNSRKSKQGRRQKADQAAMSSSDPSSALSLPPSSSSSHASPVSSPVTASSGAGDISSAKQKRKNPPKRKGAGAAGPGWTPCPHASDLTQHPHLVESAVRLLTHPPRDRCVYCRRSNPIVAALDDGDDLHVKGGHGDDQSTPSIMYTCLECGPGDDSHKKEDERDKNHGKDDYDGAKNYGGEDGKQNKDDDQEHGREDGGIASGCWHDGFFHLAAGHQGPSQQTHHVVSAVTGCGPSGFLVYCSACRRHVWSTHWHVVTELWKTVKRDRLSKLLPNVQGGDDGGGGGGGRRGRCRQVRGLVNLGQTCFLNCVLQCLLHDAHLQRHFLNLPMAHHHHHVRQDPSNSGNDGAKEPMASEHDSSKRTVDQVGKGSENADGFCAACSMDGLFQAYYAPHDLGPLAPVRFFTDLWRHFSSVSHSSNSSSSSASNSPSASLALTSNVITGYEQQDAHEFLMSALHGLHVHLGHRTFGCDCLVHGTFGGVLESSVTCGRCQTVSVTYDPFLDLSLQVPVECPSVLDCFHRFVSPEPFSQYHCGTCHTVSDATKQLRLRKLPKTLILHLKRYTPQGAKLTQPLHVPRQFSVFSFTVSTAGSPLVSYRNRYAYRLSSAVAHWGATSDGGHYTAFVGIASTGHHTVDTTWYAVNDERITLADFDADIVTSPLYLLFYNRLADDHDNPLL